MKKSKKIFRTLLWVVAGVIVIAVIGAVIKKGNQSMQSYEILKATPADTVVKNTILTGSIEPRDLVNIKPQMSGIVAALNKQPGEMVEVGEIIARIAMVADVATVQSAQSRVETARIQLDRMKEVYDRDKTLFDQKVIPLEKFEESRSAYDRAKVEYDSAKESLELVSTGSSASTRKSNNTLVRATVAGLILDCPVKVGQSVTQANNFSEGTTIVSIADLTDLLFVGNINESDVNKIKVGMDVKISIGALPDQTFPAVIEYVSPKGVNTSGTVMFEVKAALSKGNLENIRAGFSSNAEIVLERREGVLTIPEAAVTYEGGKSYVYVSKGGGKDADFTKQEVTLGLSDGIKVEVLSGLSGDEELRGNAK